MDSDDDTNEMPFPFMRISTFHRAIIEGDLQTVKQLIESGSSVNEQEYLCLYSLLHLAVMKNDLEILEYLLANDDIQVDVRCSKGKTPLNTAVELGKIKCVEKLIEHNADINIPDHEGNTPLHMSMYRPDICHLLIRHGAQINAVNYSNSTVLLNAVNCGCHEVVHMLLYYNADVNFPDVRGFCPFMAALKNKDVYIQKVLLEYVDDFNRIYKDVLSDVTTLSLALQSNSPFARDIIERGADVNYGDNPDVNDDLSAFAACIFGQVDPATFKMVWERLRYNKFKNTINLLHFFKYKTDMVPSYLEIIIESDNFEPALRFFCKRAKYFLFLCDFANKKFEVEQLTLLTCRLLECGFRAMTSEISAIYIYYNYCELLRILLYMDNDDMPGWPPHKMLLRLKFDIDYDLKSVIAGIKYIRNEDLLELLDYYVYPPLIVALTLRNGGDEQMRQILANVPKVPSLIDLARNAARKHIHASFKTINACQFYTTIDHLDILPIYKSILKFDKKIYSVSYRIDSKM